jgi:hypothetical protein
MISISAGLPLAAISDNLMIAEGYVKVVKWALAMLLAGFSALGLGSGKDR